MRSEYAQPAGGKTRVDRTARLRKVRDECTAGTQRQTRARTSRQFTCLFVCLEDGHYAMVSIGQVLSKLSEGVEWKGKRAKMLIPVFESTFLNQTKKTEKKRCDRCARRTIHSRTGDPFYLSSSFFFSLRSEEGGWGFTARQRL